MNEENMNAVVTGSGLKVAVIGVGNGGSQSALVATARGIPAMCINTSEKDLDDAIMGKSIKGYLIGDGRGSGKDRENAMALLRSNGKSGVQDLFTNPFFRSIVEPADVVFVTFSTGGGTGSGIGPAIAKMIHLAYKNKVVIPYGILPKLTESVMAQANTIACVDDIVKIGLSYMLADLSYYGEQPQEEAFKKVGQYMADTMCVIRGDYMKMSAAGMADERDTLTVISEPGYMNIQIVNDITDVMLANKTLQGYLVDSIKSSPACRIQKDGIHQYDLIIANVNSSVEDPVKAGDFTEINAYVGEPKATFLNYAVDDAISDFQVIAVFSGLTIPMDRFSAPKAKVKANKEKYERQSALSLSNDRESTEIKGNGQTRDMIMGSAKSAEADLSFLEDF